MTFSQVTVKTWCANPQDSAECLQIITTNQAEVQQALATSPWTSKKLDPNDADEFIESIQRCGGHAVRLP